MSNVTKKQKIEKIRRHLTEELALLQLLSEELRTVGLPDMHRKPGLRANRTRIRNTKQKIAMWNRKLEALE